MNCNTVKRKGGPKVRFLSWGKLFLIMLTFLCSSALKAQLSGTYTICPNGTCDYKTFSAAANDLNNVGVKGAVVFDIKAGSYNESITINDIAGASATNTITFKGAGKTATRIYYNSGNIIYLNYSRFITIQDMLIESTASNQSFGVRPVYAQNCIVRNCKIVIPAYLPNYVAHYGIYHQYCTRMTYENNEVRGGYYGIYGYDYNYSASGYHKYNGNKVTQFYYCGIYDYQYYTQGLCEIKDNYLDSSAVAAYCLMSYYSNGTQIKNNRLAFNGPNYGMYLIYPNYVGNNTNVTAEITNNFIGGSNGYPFLAQFNSSSSSQKIVVSHNTIHGYGSPTYGAYIYMSGTNGAVEFTNNSITRSGSGYTAYFYLNSSSFAALEGNNWYNNNNSISINWNGTILSTLKDYMNYSGEKFAKSQAMPLISAADYHLDQGKPAPSGKFAGIAVDYDGDARCLLFPTCGADESNFGKSKPVVQIFGNSSVVYGSPTVFYNSAKQGEPKIHKWYIDGNYQTDSIHLETTKLTGPVNQIVLVTEGCGGIDADTFDVTVVLPTKAPVSDFISDKNSVLMGGIINFYDLSTNGPSQWNWQIKPDSTYDFGLKVPAIKITYGSLSSPKWQGRFNYPGKYQVCLTASNLKGMGNKECKVDYIEVIPTVNMSQNTIIKAASGYLYDNGGPNGTPTYNQNPYTATIDPCADSVYLIIKDFALYCNYDYLQIYEGKDKSGRVLHKCTGNTGYNGKDGYTGSNQYNCANNCRPKTTDTFKAKGSMFILLDIYSGVNQTGIEAYWWSKPRNVAKPVAKFTSVDTICTNGVAAFTNASTGDEVTYQWDLDGDPSFMESTSKNSTWPYFFPGRYKVTLIATNCGGADTVTKTITVLDPPVPVVDFKADNTNPTTNDIVFFTSTTQQCVDNYEWIFTKKYGVGSVTFVNGTTRSSVSPQVVFSDTGLWSAECKASNVTGSGNKVKKDYIDVKGSYCNPSVSNLLSDIGISKVVFNTINNSSTTGTDGYQNFTPTIATTIEIGVKYTLTMERTGNKNKANRTIWLDWNGDGDFDDAQEHVADENNSSALSWSYDITVPSFANVGATKLRLAINQSNYANKVCGQNEFGEFEDYRIYITPDLTPPVITVKGKDTVFVEQGYPYVDSGATAIDNLNGNISPSIKLTTAPVFNALIPGVYKFSYNVEDSAHNKAITKYRIVIIGEDKTPPALRIAKPDTIIVGVNEIYTRPSILSADDLVDGDMRSYVSTNDPVNPAVVGIYKITYTVSDFSNNDTIVTRVVQVVDSTEPTITMLGGDTVIHDVHMAFTDPGVLLADNYYSTADLNSALVISSNVDVDKLGAYAINYTLTDPSGNGPVTIRRIVKVMDREAPKLTFIKDADMVVEVFDDFKDPGIKISDNYYTIARWDTAGTFYNTFPDGHTTRLGDYTVIYEVTDPSGNQASITRKVKVVDTESPLITLNGLPTVTICRWVAFNDEGYTMSDNYWADSDITPVMEGTFVTEGGTDRPGFYSLRYRATDRSGNVGYSSYRYIFVQSEFETACITGVDETDTESYINIFPNPNNGSFNITTTLPAADKVRISLTNALGQEVAVISNGSLGANTFTVNVSDKAAGIYMLKVVSEKYTITRQVVINK